MQRNEATGQVEDEPEETIPGASATFKEVRLRLLMKEREDVVSRLVELDYAIWTLEEFFRAGNPLTTPLSPDETSVPEGSLSLQERTPPP